MWLLLAALAALAASGVQSSTAADDHYIAAVVDFCPPPWTPHLTPEQIINSNIELAEGFVADAKKQGADIIVFPEEGMRGLRNMQYAMLMPGPGDEATPCAAPSGTVAEPLRKLSCLAANHSIYLVVNLVETVPCESSATNQCPGNGHYSYNTDLVFDRNGKIVAKYHKYHLFGEYLHQPPPSPEYSVFETDFGVRFGVFICFDILFDKPAAELALRLNVTDMVFTAAWFSEVPFLTAVQAHSGWAHALDVTVLAAGYNLPERGSTGSGVYLGRHGILNATMNWRNESTLILQRVPKHGAKWADAGADVHPDLDRFDPLKNYGAGKDPFDDVEKLYMIQDNMTMYTTWPVKRPEQGEDVLLDKTLCTDDRLLCCQFHVQALGVSLFQPSSAAASLHGYSYFRRREEPPFNKTEAEEEFDGFHYRLVAFSGVRDHSRVATTGVQVCGLISCLNEELASCGWNAPNLGSPSIKWTEFVNVTITAEYVADGTLQFPSVLAGPRYEPLPASHYNFQSELGAGSNRTVSLTTTKQAILDLRTFAIYGRHFAWDGETATGY